MDTFIVYTTINDIYNQFLEHFKATAPGSPNGR